MNLFSYRTKVTGGRMGGGGAGYQGISGRKHSSSVCFVLEGAVEKSTRDDSQSV